MFTIENGTLTAANAEELFAGLRAIIGMYTGNPTHYTINFAGNKPGLVELHWDLTNAGTITSSVEPINHCTVAYRSTTVNRFYRKTMPSYMHVLDIPGFCTNTGSYEFTCIRSRFAERIAQLFFSGLGTTAIRNFGMPNQVFEYLRQPISTLISMYLFPKTVTSIDMTSLLEELFGKKQASIINRTLAKGN